jgi:hypothetical protein
MARDRSCVRATKRYSPARFRPLIPDLEQDSEKRQRIFGSDAVMPRKSRTALIPVLVDRSMVSGRKVT